MGIRIGGTAVKRDWTQIASDAAEVAVRSIALGSTGFFNSVSALLRALRGLRGDDNIEARATRLVIETLAYALYGVIATSPLGRRPQKAEAQALVESLINRATIQAEQREIALETEHLENPASFPIFQDAAEQLFHALGTLNPGESEANATARFRKFLTEGFNRIRIRDPEYFSGVTASLSGPDARADARVRAWERYRALLIKRFEDAPLFGESELDGVTLGQVYQPLRASWDEDGDDITIDVGLALSRSAEVRRKKRRQIGMLDSLVLRWLDRDDPSDRLRLISGGPGSGKSTFAKHLAALLAQEPRWRVLFVPLQWLKGSGPLEARIDEYFRLQLEEPFDSDTAPLAAFGRDGHRDWVIIFDGLDELAKEGAGSESAAQDFASALADWRGRIGASASRFLVLGRAPSMQEARRRMGVQGEGTLHVADMLPIVSDTTSNDPTVAIDPEQVRAIDQRSEFWSRWAVAKGLPIEIPEAFGADELRDLTKEPLLAYLLIFSGYVSDRWQEAAENRNRIYHAIFRKIWERELTKVTRARLHDLGQEGFEALMQVLGLAAWRGGGRTGEETTFTSVRDIFMRPDILANAKACGAADLGNVALLFYTRKDEEGGRGYEFLHKSFGEFLTACGLLSAFQRWGGQVADTTSDFGRVDFLKRWFQLCGPAPMTTEVSAFLRNEARLQSSNSDSIRPWHLAREKVRILEDIMDAAVRYGLPAHEGAHSWRVAEAQEANAEVSLMAVLDAVGRAAYPMELFEIPAENGGWQPGPIRIAVFEEDPLAFGQFVARLAIQSHSSGLTSRDHSILFPILNIMPSQMLSRLSLRKIQLFCRLLSGANLEGANFEESDLLGATLVSCNLSGTSFKSANLSLANLFNSRMRQADFRGANIHDSHFDQKELQAAAKTDRPFVPRREMRKNRRRTGSKRTKQPPTPPLPPAPP